MIHSNSNYLCFFVASQLISSCPLSLWQIGADGAQSAVRKAAKLHTVQWPYEQTAVVATLRLAEVNHCHWCYFAYIYLWVFFFNTILAYCIHFLCCADHYILIFVKMCIFPVSCNFLLIFINIVFICSFMYCDHLGINHSFDLGCKSC